MMSSVERGRRMSPNRQRSVASRPKRLVREAVEFSVRGPVAVNLDEHHATLPGCSVIDLLFTKPSKIRELVFRNYYTAWVTVIVRVALNQDGASTSKECKENMESTWITSISHRSLMTNPHRELGAQDFISIPFYESNVAWDSLLAIRLVLRQPSSLWKTFHVEELNVYGDFPRYGPSHNYSHPQGAPRQIQHYEHVLTTVVRQTVDSLKQKPVETYDGSSTSKDNTQVCYEFFSLPQV